jgi:hypothetical protein
MLRTEEIEGLRLATRLDFPFIAVDMALLAAIPPRPRLYCHA